MANRVLLVGWEGADWTEVHPLLDRGKLPTLQRLIDSGSGGTLKALPPLARATLWTSLATGRHPATHGVLGENEIRPDGGGVQAIGKRSWRAAAFWEYLAASGIGTAVVNWPATSPADHWSGTVIDDQFAIPVSHDFDTWPVPLHSVSPDSWREIMTDLRVHPREIGRNELAGLVPGAPASIQSRDRRLARLAVSLSRTASVHAAATHLAEAASWDLLAVRYTLLADVAEDLRRRSQDDETPDALYAGTLPAAYRFADMMLARLLVLAGKDTRVFLIAPPSPSVVPAGDDVLAQPRPGKGLIVGAGPGMAVDTLIHGATILDVAPTILRCFGLSAETDGRSLDAMFAGAAGSLSPVSIAAGQPQAGAADPAAHLHAMGYADRRGAAPEAAIAAVELGALRALAESHIARAEWRAAAAALERVLLRVPDDQDASRKLGRALLQLGDIEAARPVLETYLAIAPKSPAAHLLMAALLTLAQDPHSARRHLQHAKEFGADQLGVLLRIGWLDLMLKRVVEAESAFREALGRDGNDVQAHTGLGLSLQAQGRDGEAEDALRRAIVLEFDNPVAHLALGQVLAKRGATPEAIQAARMSLAQRPGSREGEALLSGLKQKLAAEFGARSTGPARRP